MTWPMPCNDDDDDDQECWSGRSRTIRLRTQCHAPDPAMPFLMVCVAPGASEAQVVEVANSIGWWAFDTQVKAAADP